MICTVDESKMCEGCAKEHAQRTNHYDHLMTYIDWFKKQNEVDTKKGQAAALIKKILKKTIEELPSEQESHLMLLEKRKNDLKAYVDSICQEQISKAKLNKEFAKYQLEKSFHALYSKNPSSSGLAHLISNLTKQEEVDELVFSEVLNPESSPEFSDLLKNSLNLSIKIYPSAKPLSIVYLRPSSSSIYWFNTLREKLDILQEPKKFFNMYYAWCILPNLSILFSGGCSTSSITSEVFTMEPETNYMEYCPSMIVERYMHGMIFLDSCIYVFGGATQIGNTKSCEKWIIGSKSWEIFGELNSSKVKLTVCLLERKIYIGDENEIELYNTEDNSFKVISVFKNIHYMIMVPLSSGILIFRKDNLYLVTPEPIFTTKQIAKIPLLEYSSLGQPIHVANKVFFLLDFNRAVYSYDLDSNVLKQLVILT